MNTEINLIAKSLARSKHSSVIGGKTNGIDDSNNIYTNGFDSNMPDANSDFHVSGCPNMIQAHHIIGSWIIESGVYFNQILLAPLNVPQQYTKKRC